MAQAPSQQLLPIMDEILGTMDRMQRLMRDPETLVQLSTMGVVREILGGMIDTQVERGQDVLNELRQLVYNDELRPLPDAAKLVDQTYDALYAMWDDENSVPIADKKALRLAVTLDVALTRRAATPDELRSLVQDYGDVDEWPNVSELLSNL